MPRDTETADVVVGPDALTARLTLPVRPVGVVAFAHGSGSGRHSPRNRSVADALERRGLATLLVDLLTGAEAARDRVTGEVRFDVQLLAARVADVVDWLASDVRTRGLRIGVYGASTGAAAALIAAARRPAAVAAVVSRGGRPDLAADALRRVTAPTLLVVGARDPVVLAWNREACSVIAGPCDLAVVPGAGHLFEEPGALDEVARLAGDHFLRHLAADGAQAGRA